MSPKTIRKAFPEGIRDIEASTVWSTLPGQPTDDSEMAIALARSILAAGGYRAKQARAAYLDWLSSRPFDVGSTVRKGLAGIASPNSQANGAMMRISPLGIYGASQFLDEVSVWAAQDARITHPNRVCADANSLYARAIAHAVGCGLSHQDLFECVVQWASADSVCEEVRSAVIAARTRMVTDFQTQAGWVLLAFGNALWHLARATPFEKALVETVSQGGDADTNGAICGALLGAVQGEQAVPSQWKETVLSCRPKAGEPGVARPRPERFWPSDALELADKLLFMGQDGRYT